MTEPLTEPTTVAPPRTRRRTPNNRPTTSFHISDELWAVLQPLLPARPNTHRFGGGRPPTPDRRCADAIFCVLRTGGQWDSLSATDLCPKSTAHGLGLVKYGRCPDKSAARWGGKPGAIRRIGARAG